MDDRQSAEIKSGYDGIHDFVSHTQRTLPKFFPIDLLDSKCSPAQKLKNLGIIFDSEFNFLIKYHISPSHVYITWVTSVEYADI